MTLLYLLPILCSYVFGTVYQWLVDADALDLDAVIDGYVDNTIAFMTYPNNNEETNMSSLARENGKQVLFRRLR